MGKRIICAGLLFAAVGCGVSQAKLDEAKSMIQQGLETWKKGGKPADLRSGSRPVEFHEAMWNSGDKLLSYELNDPTYHSREDVIRCEARLTVRTRGGRQKTENILYEVKFGSPVKIMNNPMP
jgi:hypothetical protein